jgi:ABC-2 type transport system permease protein
MSSTRGFRELLRLELSDAVRSKWVAFACTLYFGLAAAFVWLGMRESTVLGFTGLSRVLLNITSTLVVIGPLLVLIGTHAAVVRGRTSGFCELMLTRPVRRANWYFALFGARAIILVGPFLVLLLGCALGSVLIGGEPELLAIACKSLAICVSLIFSFIGIGLLLSSLAQSSERALVWALVVFVVSAALHDVLLIALLLRTRLPPELVFALAALNPGEAARVGILASADPELSVLGPVGFWLANQLGASTAVLAAVAWPALLGLLTTWLGLRRVRRLDLVA